jgi:hypothetical protein
MTEVSAEGRRELGDPAATDVVLVAFSDRAAEVHGTLRIGIGGSPATAAVLGIVFASGRPAGASVEAAELEGEADWAAIEVAGVGFQTVEPLRAWRASFDDGQARLELELNAITGPIPVADRPGWEGLDGYEQICHVAGRARVGGREATIDCLGRREHTWGAVDWERTDTVRRVDAWLDDGGGLLIASSRPAGAQGHEEEALSAILIDVDDDGEQPELFAAAVADPRVSTTYDGDGHQIRAGLELWVADDDELPVRGAGHAVCGTTLELGRLRLETAFFDWSVAGRHGTGRYDILRRG